jgi:2-amino-4-hydroxy-6-hydroxymethyldihydropteridine diphosphokinase
MPNSQLIYLSLGSNLGDRFGNLTRAMEALRGIEVSVLRQSSIYETEPVDILDQPWFLNCVLEVQTSLAPLQLLKSLQGIERQMGSRKLIARGPRLIDLDILLYGDLIVHTEEMEIPHPRMAGRRFVLVPLAELAPGVVHPALQKTIADLLSATQDRSAVKIWRRPGSDTDSVRMGPKGMN